MSTRDEFSEDTKRKVALRANQHCSFVIVVQQHQRVRTPGQTMGGRPVPRQLGQVAP